MAVWPRRFPTAEAARPFVRNPAALAEKVYGGRADLGNTEPGDGARFIGRGYLQITGRANYREMGQRIGLDLEAEPDRAAEPQIAVQIACAFWTARRLNLLCDTGRFYDVTRRINGGAVGYDERIGWLERARAATGWPLSPDRAPLDLSRGPVQRAACG
jgi:putative chitinase